MRFQLAKLFAGTSTCSSSSVEGCEQAARCDKAGNFGAAVACGVLLFAGLLISGTAAADDEVEQLRLELKKLQQRIDQLEQKKESPPAVLSEELVAPVPADPVAVAPAAPVAAAPTGDEGFVSKDASGNDPRDFGSKFMPYYRYMELENDMEVHSFTAFGFYAFNERFGMTYELPLAQEFDYSEVDAFKNASSGTLPPAGPLPGAPGGLPIGDLDPDGDVTGMGDLGLRFFLRPRELEFSYMDDTKNLSIMPLVEWTLPTANKDLLGGEALIASPGFAVAFDLPANKPPFSLGFVAMMNFYDFDVFKDGDRDDTSRYRGRWFYQQPLTKPAFVDNPSDTSFHIFDWSGLYLMPELQPVYDFKENDFSLWLAPEIGKVLRKGTIVYAKPGWGIDNDQKGDRDFTFEVGFRYFMD